MRMRTRLLLVTIAVIVTTLIAAGTATYVAFRSAVFADVDQSLREVALPLRPDPTDDERGPEPAVAPFVQLRGADGTVTRTINATFPNGTTAAPELPTAIVTPGPTDDAGGPAAFFTAPEAGGGLVTFRVKASTGSSGEQLIIALPIDDELTTLRQLAVIEAVVISVASLAAAMLAWWLVGIGLAPLTRLTHDTRNLGGAGSGDRVTVPAPTTEVGELGKAMNTMLDDVDAAFAERDATEARLRQFVADASHELRTPIAAVSAYAELFELGAEHRPDDLRRAMTGIRSESSRMGSLTEDLLTLARLDEGGGAATNRIVALDDVAGAAVAAARLLDPQRRITADLAPATVVGDPAALRQVLDNLLSNVRHHTPADAAVDVRTEAAADTATITVADSGPGVPEDEMAQMFDRFWRADRARSRANGGSGLGLAIVAATAQRHGGTVAASHTPGGGLTLTVTLPVASPAPEDPAAT